MRQSSIKREPSLARTLAASDLPMPSIVEDESADRQVLLSTAQEQALEWLFNGGSLTEAAQFAGVTRQTISRWMRSDEDFRTIYSAWREETAGIIHARLIAAGEAAMDVVLTAVREKRDLQAAQFVVRTITSGRR
jgi:hypothetical protein